MKTQMIGVRIEKDLWNEFEIKCIEDGITMSDVMRYAINEYLGHLNTGCDQKIINSRVIDIKLNKVIEDMDFKESISFVEGVKFTNENIVADDYIPTNENFYDGWDKEKFIEGIKWYREQLKQRQ